jgi:SAM-dependent methyltransferase
LSSSDPAERASREQKAWDEDHVWENCNAWERRVFHVFEGPNTQHAQQVFDAAVAAKAHGSRVLDIGCGHGLGTMRLLDFEPELALGIDVSLTMIESARENAAATPRVEFRLQSAQDPMADRFGLIIGRAVLHHIDFREFLRRAYDDNLLPGGRMVFIEPMGHPLVRGFHLAVRSAHTPDERPILRRDIDWMRTQFPNVTVHGVNLVSFPAGIVSTRLFSSADNRLMHFADRLDRTLLRLSPGLAIYARQGIIVIDKPPGAAP